MKLFLSIALILAVTLSFGDCTSPKAPKADHSPKSLKSPKAEHSPKAKKSDHEELTNALGALSLEGESSDGVSPAYQFASTVKDVISKNYQIYTEIKGYVDSFVKHEGDWSPIELIIIKMKMTFDISDSEELTALKNQFNTYKPKLVELMGKIKPAHEQNQKLAEAVNSFVNAETKLADLTTETKIDPKLSEEMHKDAEKVNAIFKEFQNVMKNFQMNFYVQKLEDVRAAINKVKNQEMYLDSAQQVFAENVKGSQELVAPNVGVLDAALKIHYADLAKVSQQLQGVVKKVMHATHAPEKHAKK